MIPTKPKRGRPRESVRPRAQLSASIAADTSQQLSDWLTLALRSNDKAHVGRVLDLIVSFGKKYQFHKTISNPPKL